MRVRFARTAGTCVRSAFCGAPRSKAAALASVSMLIAILLGCSNTPPPVTGAALASLEITRGTTLVFSDVSQVRPLVALAVTMSGRVYTGPLVWNSSDPSVVTVSSGGDVTSVGVGSATVSVAAGGLRDSIGVVVSRPVSVPIEVDEFGFPAEAWQVSTEFGRASREASTDSTVLVSDVEDTLVVATAPDGTMLVATIPWRAVVASQAQRASWGDDPWWRVLTARMVAWGLLRDHPMLAFGSDDADPDDPYELMFECMLLQLASGEPCSLAYVSSETTDAFEGVVDALRSSGLDMMDAQFQDRLLAAAILVVDDLSNAVGITAQDVGTTLLSWVGHASAPPAPARDTVSVLGYDTLRTFDLDREHFSLFVKDGNRILPRLDPGARIGGISGGRGVDFVFRVFQVDASAHHGPDDIVASLRRGDTSLTTWEHKPVLIPRNSVFKNASLFNALIDWVKSLFGWVASLFGRTNEDPNSVVLPGDHAYVVVGMSPGYGLNRRGDVTEDLARLAGLPGGARQDLGRIRTHNWVSLGFDVYSSFTGIFGKAKQEVKSSLGSSALGCGAKEFAYGLTWGDDVRALPQHVSSMITCVGAAVAGAEFERFVDDNPEVLEAWNRKFAALIAQVERMVDEAVTSEFPALRAHAASTHGTTIEPQVIVVVPVLAALGKFVLLWEKGMAAGGAFHRFGDMLIGLTPLEIAVIEIGRPAYAPIRYALSVSPAELSATTPQGGSHTAMLDIENTGGGAVSVGIVTRARWIDVSPADLTRLEPGDTVMVAVTLDASDLAPGDYGTTLVVRGLVGHVPYEGVDVPVRLSVAAATSLAPMIEAFTPDPATITEGSSSTLHWTVTGSEPLSLSIDRGVGDVSGLASAEVYPAATTTYTLTASNGHGVDSRQVTVIVEEAARSGPVARLTTDPPGQARVNTQVVLDASESTFGDGTASRYEFQTGDGRSRTLSAATWPTSYATVGSFEPCVRVQSTEGEWSTWACTRLNVHEESVGGPDLVLDNYRHGTSENFFGMSVDHGEGFQLRVTWRNDGDPLPEGHPEFVTQVFANGTLLGTRVHQAGHFAGRVGHAVEFASIGASLEPGEYTVLMMVDATNTIQEVDESNNTASFYLSVDSLPPVADFSASTDCLTASFTDASTHPKGDGRIVRRTWDFRDGNASTQRNPTHTFAAAGTYSVRLTVEDEWGNTHRRTRSVSVESCAPPAQPPVITAFAASPSAITAGESATLQWSVTGDEPMALSITPGVGGVSGQSSATVSPAATTTYTLTASNEAGAATATTTVSVSAAPSVVVSVAPSSVTLPVNDTQSFTATVTGASDTSVTWSVGCGSLSGSGNTRTYTAPGSARSCTLTVTSVADPTKQATAAITVIEPEPPAAPRFTMVAAGERHSLALDQFGNAWAWGRGSHGQLGNGSTGDQLVPVSVSMPPGVSFTTLSAGDVHSLALDEAGNAWAWGRGLYGRLGQGGTQDATVPVAVAMPSGVRFEAIRAGGNHSLALDRSGNVWAWGDGYDGQLGDGRTGGSAEALTPVRIDVSGTTFVEIGAGRDHSLAIDQSGAAWAWGRGEYGRLGDGSSQDRSRPVRVTMPSGTTFVLIAGARDHSLALDGDGRAWGWGEGFHGQLGNGGRDDQVVPVRATMPSGRRFVAIAGGGGQTVAIDQHGAAWAYGDGRDGMLGNGDDRRALTPDRVSLPSGITAQAVSAGRFHTLLVDADGAAWAWGRGSEGQRGDGTTTRAALTPVPVSMPPAAP